MLYYNKFNKKLAHFWGSIRDDPEIKPKYRRDMKVGPFLVGSYKETI